LVSHPASKRNTGVLRILAVGELYRMKPRFAIGRSGATGATRRQAKMPPQFAVAASGID
jgi:hypothetical protein